MRAYCAAIAVACLALSAPCTADNHKAPAPAPAPAATTATAAPAAAAVTQIQPAQPADRPTGSLWGTSSCSLLSDHRAHKVGDTLTIVVQEATTGSASANTKTSRQDSTSFSGLASGFATLNRLLQGFNASTGASMNGQGTTDRTGTLTTRLTVLVTEIEPDGNLKVEGTRDLTINKEKQTLRISGVVRPEDVTSANTVSSVSVANAKIQLDGKGTVGSRQGKGLLERIFGWLF